MAVKGEYDAAQIQILEGLQHVRKRPGMYIGDTGSAGLHHLVYEIADNSVDEAMAGHCSTILVEVGRDDLGEWIVVQDNGRGIPIAINKDKKISSVRVVMEYLNAGGKFGGEGSGYKVSGGLHGVGISVVNALSKRMEAHVVREGRKYGVVYEGGGKVVDEYEKAQPKGNIEGTYVKFWADDTIFDEVAFDYDKLATRFRQTAFLTPQVKITLRDLRGDEPEEAVFHYENGLMDFIAYLTRKDKPIVKEPCYVSGTANAGEPTEVAVDVALTYIASDREKMQSFANNIENPEGGTHVAGFRAALTRALNEYMKTPGTSFRGNKGKPLGGEDVREGLAAVISVKLAEPQFEGQTKGKLGSQHVQGATNSVVYEGLRRWLEQHPAYAKAIIERCLANQRAREAAKRAADANRKSATGIDSPFIGKLTPCSGKNPADCELFLVEGDSAGGSAKSGRDQTFQAILALKGKILNVQKSSLADMLKDDAIQTIVGALGCGIGKDFDIEKLRYHKVIIMTDADVDGAHIRTLLMTLFVKHFRPLVDEGHIWVARPPLFRLTRKGNQREYHFTPQELRKRTGSLRSGEYEVTRFKGLGEMKPADLWATTMDPATRRLQKIVVDDVSYLDETVDTLMGDAVAPRKRFIEQFSRQHGDLAND